MEQSSLNLNDLSIKARTKNEVYRILTTEANLYLPLQKETSIYFIRDIIHGRKKVSHSVFQHKPPPLGSGGGLCKKNLHVPPPHSPT